MIGTCHIILPLSNRNARKQEYERRDYHFETTGSLCQGQECQEMEVKYFGFVFKKKILPSQPSNFLERQDKDKNDNILDLHHHGTLG